MKLTCAGAERVDVRVTVAWEVYGGGCGEMRWVGRIYKWVGGLISWGGLGWDL